MKIVFLQSFENQDERIHQSSNPPKSGYINNIVQIIPITMQLNTLKDRPEVSGHVKLDRIYAQFGQLLAALKDRQLSPETVSHINDSIEELNHSVLTGDHLARLVKKKQTSILKVLEKTDKLTPRNHYRTLWMVVGMSAFGLPIGAAIGSLVSNMGLLAVGLPIGMVIGLAVGSGMDKKALQEGRQLDVEIKY